MRRCSFLGVIPLLLLLLLSQPGHAAKGIRPDGRLDKATISKAYFEGEFWTVITALEEYRKKSLATGTRDDSVYTYKYLSVVYAAEPSTRQKAESYMYLLLKMMPTIDLLDLYISDNIESIFQKVRSDFERMQRLNEPKEAVAKPDSVKSTVAVEQKTVAPPVAATARPLKEHPRRKVKPWVWFALGGGVAASVATYVLLSDGGDNSGNPTQTWEPRFDIPQQ